MTEDLIGLLEQSLNDANIWTLSPDELRKRQGEMLKTSFKFHYDNCEDYRKYCEAKGVDPSMIQGLEDAYKIPLLDSWNTLRNREFYSVPEDTITSKFSSSGTTGNAVLWSSRDDRSFGWQMDGMKRMLEDIMNMQPGDTLIMVPDMSNLLFSQIFTNLLPKLGHKYYIGLAHEMKDGRPNIFPDQQVLTEFFQSPAETKNVIGYPFTVAELKDFTESKGLAPQLGKNGTIMTAGGWKAKTETMPYAKLSRPDLEELLSSTFSVPKENIRDVYGATELISSCWECLHYKDGQPVKNMHVAPWMYLILLDPDTLEPTKEGEPGRAAFLDFGWYAHPGFILTDDILRIVSQDGCACGKPGQVIEFVDRVKGVGDRGCAFIVRDKLFSEEYVRMAQGAYAGAGVKTEAGAMDAAEAEGVAEKKTGVISYVQERSPSSDGEEMQVGIKDVVRAMEEIIEVLKTLKIEDSVEESLTVVDLAKHLCYKKGVPTIMTEKDLVESSPGVPREKVLEMLTSLERANLVLRNETDGKVNYQVTPKADELGEAIFPVFIWALKWSEIEKGDQ